MVAGKKKNRPGKKKDTHYDDKRQEKSRYDKGKSFENKVGDVFKLMGFEVEYNRNFGDNQIDVFIKEKRKIGKKYAYYICECKKWDKKVVGVDVVRKTFSVRESVKQELSRKGMGKDCDAIVVSARGFTEEAINNAENYGIILNTYNQLLAELMDFDTYITGLIHNFEGSELQRLYIQQDFIPERTLEEINSFRFVEKWLTEAGRKQFSLLGDYGTGKTSFAKVLAYNMAKAYKEEPGKSRIPFLVNLRDCKGAFSLQNLLHQQLVNANVKPANEEIFLKLLAEGQILLIFDAFDEMATMSSAESTLSNFKQLNQAVTGEAKVILTSRTHYFRDKAEVDRVLKKEGIKGISIHASMLLREISGKSEYEIVHLKEFSDSQVKEYLEKAIGDEWEIADKKIRSIYNLHDLSFRPVLLDMIVKTLPKIETGAKEFNVVHLYEAYTQFWFEREDHRLKITKEGKEALVEGLAYKLWQEDKTGIHYKDLSGIISEHLKEKINTLRDLEAADYEVRTASFLVRDEGGNYSFAHRSFQEFFIARKIKKELLKENFDILDLRLLSKEIVFFLTYFMENHQLTLQLAAGVLETGYRERISENALFIFYRVLKIGFLQQHFSLKEDIEFPTGYVEAFKEKIQGHLLKRLDLANALLSEWTLPHMVFKQTDFTAAFMEDAVFTGTTFEDVVFNRTRMKGSDFSGSVFRNVRFEKTDANHCNFRNCRFENCSVKDSDFSMSNFLNGVFKACTIRDNDFVGTGFYSSNFKMEKHKKNYYFGVGVPGTKTSRLSPVLVNQGHKGSVNAVVISNGGRFAVSGSSDSTVKLWEVETGHLIKTFAGHESGVNSVFLSPDNQRMVSGGSDSTVKLWEVETGRLIKTFAGHKLGVNSVFLSPDNRRMVSGGSDFTVKLWDLETGHLIRTFEAYDDMIDYDINNPQNLHRLYYRDRLALYPAKDLPELGFQKTEDKKQMTDDENKRGGR